MVKLKEFLYALYWRVMKLGFIWHKPQTKARTQKRYTIGVTTYIERYEHLFKPYFLQLVSLFPDTEIVVTVNGHYQADDQEAYLEKIGGFIQQYPNAKMVAYKEPQGLSRLWNQLILNSSTERTIICNEDLEITPLFRHDLEKSGILNSDLALINKSWSHFLISKKTVRENGWFDERLTAIGNEDEDYEARMALKGLGPDLYHFRSIRPIYTEPTVYSYGAEVDVINTKYIKSNKQFFDTKWQISLTAQPGFHFVRILNAYVQLRPGMETPQHYDLNNL